MKQKAIDSIATIGLIFILPLLTLACTNSTYSDSGRCNGVSCIDRNAIPPFDNKEDPSTCESGFCLSGICEKNPLPDWAIFLIAGVLFVIVVSLGFVYRHFRNKRLKAQFLERNQMVAAGAAPMIVNHHHHYIQPQPYIGGV